MTKAQRYLLYCMEIYRRHNNLSGEQVYDKFKKYHFDTYILDLYDLLHLNGTNCLLNELDEYQAAQEKRSA